MIPSNPFLSQKFTAIWARHFAPHKTLHNFGLLPCVSFTKNRFFPLFTNVGKTLTKGMEYRLDPEATGESRKKVFLIYDVPTYFELATDTGSTDIALHRSRQYPGFLIGLNGFKSLNHYLATTFSKSSRYKLKKYKKRFEASFDVRYVMYRSEMARAQYDFVFKTFRELLEKRFDDKQTSNNNLNPGEWQFYHEVTYPMLLENKAALFVIYNGDTPIGVTLNFFSGDTLFDAITVFDIDYAKFHVGSITIMALLEWCLENNLKTFDFSKGYFDYKTRWATKTYDFEYHIYYDTRSHRARAIALVLKKYFDLKQILRERKINEEFHRMTYRLRNKASTPSENKSYTFAEIGRDELEEGQPIRIPSGMEKGRPLNTMSELEYPGRINTLPQLDLDRPEYRSLRVMVFEYLYLHDGHYGDIKVYRVPDKADHYYLVCKATLVLVISE